MLYIVMYVFLHRCKKHTLLCTAKHVKPRKCWKGCGNRSKSPKPRGRWSEVQRYWDGYNGTAPEVYDAAMEAAYSGGQYAHGATIFKKRFNDITSEVDLNFLLTGLRLFQKAARQAAGRGRLAGNCHERLGEGC